MPDFTLPWGGESLEVTLPAGWKLLQVAEPESRPSLEDWPGRLARVLSTAGGDMSLSRLLSARRRGRVVIIVEDMTRHSPLPEILTVLLREIRHAGIEDRQLEIFFANGMHPPMSPEHAAEKLGGAAEGIAWRSNQYDDESAYVRLGRIGNVDVRVDRGVAEADLRIIVSSISPHLQAGFGGGYKMLFPGCAHLETIRGLHRLGIGHKPRQLVGMDVTVNPMRVVIDAAGQLLDEYHGATYALQYLLDEDNVPYSIDAGEMLGTHRMVAKQCAAGNGLVVPELADVLITNAFPRDFDLWQSFKCIANTRWAARPNGAIICLTRCEGGLHGMKPPPWPLDPVWTRRIVRWMGHEGLSSTVTRLLPRLAGDAAFFIRMATQTIYRNPIYMVSPKLHDEGIHFPGLHILPTIDDALAAAGKYLGRGPQRVTVFPHGGTTFPVANLPI